MNNKQFAICLMLLLVATVLLSSHSTAALNQPSVETANVALKTTEVKVYLVALNDNGKSGRKIGCDDSLVAVTRTVQPTAAPLRAALDELLKMPQEYEQAGLQLGNYWKGDDLKVKSVTLKSGTATIRITGSVSVAGICDQPRITEQIEATARQFSTVKRVRVFINGVSLRTAIS